MSKQSNLIRPPQPLLIRAWNFLSTEKANEKSFSFDEITQAAMGKSGLKDFGGNGFEAGLKALLSAFEQVRTHHPFGRFYVRQMVIQMLIHRLRNVNLIHQRPEILSQDIARPIIVLGLPRSGTTLLFNLLAQDPNHRFLRNWEAFISQVPSKGRYTEATDPRIRQARWMQRFLKYLMPEVDTVHVFTPEGPEECTPILMQGFATQSFVGGFDVPEYSRWLDQADHAPTYRYHRRVLQALQWKYPGGRWLLKSPDHLAAVRSILEVYPGACFVHIHRNPLNSVSSWASLNLVYRSVYYNSIDMHELGRQVLGRLSTDMDRYLADRPSLPSRLFFDVGYQALVSDPIGAVQDIYDYFGLELTLEARSNMESYLANNPKNKHGVHRYSPEDFGLSQQVILERFSDYSASFQAYLGKL